MEASSSPFGSSELLYQVPFQGTAVLQRFAKYCRESLQLGKPGVPD